MPHNTIAVRERYRDMQVAARYDRKRFTGVEGRLNQRCVQRALRKALGYVPAHGRVLDIPCGTARFSWMLAANGFRTVASDVSLEMMQIGRSIGGHDVAQPQFLQSDIFRLPFPDRAFAAVVCVRFMNLMDRPHRIAAVREMGRVADLLIVSYYHKYTWKYFGRSVRRALGLDNKVKPRLSLRALKEEIAEAGGQLQQLIAVAPVLSENWVVVIRPPARPVPHVASLHAVGSSL